MSVTFSLYIFYWTFTFIPVYYLIIVYAITGSLNTSVAVQIGVAVAFFEFLAVIATGLAVNFNIVQFYTLE